MINLVKIGQKIAEMRKKHHMTQNDLAETLFVTHQAISKWENGKSIPNLEILYELTKLFNITIDYLLDDNELDEDTYEIMFQSTTREAVINHFLNKPSLKEEIPKIFYLLNPKERMIIINQVIHKIIDLSIETIWPLLSMNERQYLLMSIVTGKLDYNLNKIAGHLTLEEQLMVRHHAEEGTYPYKIFTRNIKLKGGKK